MYENDTTTQVQMLITNMLPSEALKNGAQYVHTNKSTPSRAPTSSRTFS